MQSISVSRLLFKPCSAVDTIAGEDTIGKMIAVVERRRTLQEFDGSDDTVEVRCIANRGSQW